MQAPTLKLPTRKQRYSSNKTSQELKNSSFELEWFRMVHFVSSDVDSCITKLRSIFPDVYPTVREAGPDRYFLARIQIAELEDELSLLLETERERYKVFATREFFFARW